MGVQERYDKQAKTINFSTKCFYCVVFCRKFALAYMRLKCSLKLLRKDAFGKDT